MTGVVYDERDNDYDLYGPRRTETITYVKRKSFSLLEILLYVFR